MTLDPGHSEPVNPTHGSLLCDDGVHGGELCPRGQMRAELTSESYQMVQDWVLSWRNMVLKTL